MKIFSPIAYSAHELLVSQARARPEIWRLLIGLGIVAAVTITVSSFINGFVQGFSPDFYRAEMSNPARLGTSPVSMLILMGSFIVVALGVAVAARIMQKRTLASIIGPLALTFRQFWKSIRVLAILAAVLFVLPPFDVGGTPTQNMPITSWLALLPLSVLVVLIQTSAEEILFRGYLQQTLAARFSNPLVWMILPSALFALGHFTPEQAGENAVLIAIWAGLFGLLAADLTARSGTLGPAIALHLFNNVTALLVLAMPDSLNGLSLYILPFSMSDAEQIRSWLAVDFAMLVVSWLAVRLALSR